MHREFAPPDALRGSVKCFWHTRREFDGPEFEVVPDGYAEIIFYFGSSCGIFNNGVLQALPSPFLMGLLNRPVVLGTEGRLDVIGVRCYPWTVFDLLGLAPGTDDWRAFAHPIAQLQPVLAAHLHAGRTERAVAALARCLLRRPIPVDPTLFKAGAAMLGACGGMPVSQVAAAAHATVRTLERKFKQSSGRTVKDVSGRMRFEQARNRLWNDPEASVSALAHELGYTDQSHLSREFRRYSGMTPAAFARKRRS